MNKDWEKRYAAKGDAAAIGDRTGEKDCPVIVVGIGASAGSLKSVKQLFARMPRGHGVAFVLIQHLDPSVENLTVRRLRDQTAFDVVEAAEGMPVLADRIHVIPPNTFLNISGCRLTLQEPVLCNGLRMPIDHFFCSLAADQRQRGCAILLSGTGSDGTLGFSEIKASGGRTLMENPDHSEFADMPKSAIAAGVVDTVLPAGAMAEAIVAFSEQVIAETRNEPAESPEFDANIRAVLEILRLEIGHDFRCYKPNTLVRRIRRRMTLTKVATLADYVRFLQEHPEEVGLLQKDLLIGVTEFFRQPHAWEILEEKVIARLVENALPGSEIRVWVPGCSTGKEAYSLAMLLTEQVEKSDKKVAIQIFATDSGVVSLATARSGKYTKEEIGEGVSSERLKRFFTPKDGYYQVIKKIRELAVFAPQNLTADPPFSKLDLISCRNLLIYLEQEVQKKIIALFHFALREGGFLFLGTAETAGDREDLFEPVSKKWRIYRRIGIGRPVGVEIPVRPTGGAPVAPGKSSIKAYTPRSSLASMAQQMLLDRFAPACVMIDRKLQVLYVHGAVEDYLTFPPGELTTRVVDMAREGLRARLRGAIDQCLEINRPVSVTARVRRGSTGLATGREKSVPVKATVTSLRYPRETDGLLLIAFEDYPVSAAKSQRKATGESDVHQLTDELKVTREELQSTIEQLEVSNDQLKASNEEVTAANEELQSANEEMETSKEELQSLNEELNTINARLHEKVGELEDTNNDVVNLLSSTNIATVFLDKELKVKRYTPASTRFFSLIPSDIGRPIGDVLRRFRDEGLLDDVRRVLSDLTPLSKEVQAGDGGWYIRRITPYRTQEDRIEGVVVTFVDVQDLKQAEERIRSVALFPDENPFPILRVAGDGKLLFANRAATALLEQWQCRVATPVPESVQRVLRTALETGLRQEIEVRCGEQDLSFMLVPIIEHNYVNFYGRDITKRKRAEETILRAKEEWEHTFDTVPDLIALLDNQHRIVRVNRSMADRLGVTPEQCIGLACHEAVHGLSQPPAFCPHALTCQDGKQHIAEVNDPRLGGDFLVSTTPLCDAQGRLTGSVHVARDITERKRAETALRDSEARLNRSQEIAHLGSWELDLVSNHLTWSDEVYRIFGLRPQEFDATYEAFLEAVHPDDRAAVDAAYSGSLREGRDIYEIEHRVVRKSTGEVRIVHEKCEHFRDANRRIIRSIGMVHDITEHKRAEQSLRSSEARFKLLSDTAGKLLSTDDPQGIVYRLCRDVMMYLDCQVFFNFLVDEEAGRLHLNASAGIPEEEARKIEWLDYGAAVCGCVAQERHRIVMEDISNVPDPRTELVKSYGIHAYACHPLMVRERLLGTISFGTKTRAHFSLEDLALMTTVTDEVAIAMERMRLIKELQRSREELEKRVQERTAELAEANETLRQLSLKLISTQEEERRRVAVDIHDTLGSCLSAIKFKMQDVLQRTGKTGGVSIESLNAVLPMIQEGIEDCRRIQMDLRPSLLDDLGLLATLSWFLRRFQTIYSKIQIEQEIEVEESDISHSLKIVVFRVTQEALNNIAKHSEATLARLSLQKLDDRIDLVLKDNGTGFDVEKVLSRESAKKGLGLVSMKERTELSGGSFAIESTEGEGTIIRASWPLQGNG